MTFAGVERKPPNREPLRAQRRGGSVNRNEGNLKHTKWECKYHVVFIPKYRKKNIYGWVRTELGPIIRELARQKEAVVEEGHLMYRRWGGTRPRYGSISESKRKRIDGWIN